MRHATQTAAALLENTVDQIISPSSKTKSAPPANNSSALTAGQSVVPWPSWLPEETGAAHARPINSAGIALNGELHSYRASPPIDIAAHSDLSSSHHNSSTRLHEEFDGTAAYQTSRGMELGMQITGSSRTSSHRTPPSSMMQLPPLQFPLQTTSPLSSHDSLAHSARMPLILSPLLNSGTTSVQHRHSRLLKGSFAPVQVGMEISTQPLSHTRY